MGWGGDRRRGSTGAATGVVPDGGGGRGEEPSSVASCAFGREERKKKLLASGKRMAGSSSTVAIVCNLHVKQGQVKLTVRWTCGKPRAAAGSWGRVAFFHYKETVEAGCPEKGLNSSSFGLRLLLTVKLCRSRKTTGPRSPDDRHANGFDQPLEPKTPHQQGHASGASGARQQQQGGGEGRIARSKMPFQNQKLSSSSSSSEHPSVG